MFKWLIEKKLDDFAQDVDFASFKNYWICSRTLSVRLNKKISGVFFLFVKVCWEERNPLGKAIIFPILDY